MVNYVTSALHPTAASRGGYGYINASRQRIHYVIVCWVGYYQLLLQHLTVSTFVVPHLSILVAWLQCSCHPLLFTPLTPAGFILVYT